jgi:glycosyltransferase involved in cell wall biosynthesis
LKLIVVSICKDEAETIGQVLDQIPKQIKGIDRIEKLVIDDGSSDGTAAVAKKHGAKVISDGMQKRLAFRFREAIDLVLTDNADVMVNIDGDLQFDPFEIPRLIQPILDDKADFVVSNRFKDPKTGQVRRPAGMPWAKYMGNKLGARVVSELSNRDFKDVTCGFRAYNRTALLALNINSDYTYTQESFQVLAMKRLRIVDMPVSIKYYPGRKSRVVRGIFQFIFGSALNILRAYRDYAPFRFFGLLGLVFFVPGLALLSFVAVHWVRVGAFTPYKAVGLLGLYLFTLSILLWALGLVADMFDRMLNNQEKILELTKRQLYERKTDKTKR